MPTTRKLILMIPFLLFILACQAVLSPVRDVQNVASTVQSVATAAIEMSTEMAPIATVFAEPTQGTDVNVPNELPTGIPEGIFNPQGAPLSTWRDIPIMPQATAGQELEGMYSFKTNSSAQEVRAYYEAELPKLGWSSLFSSTDMPFLVYSKDNATLTVTLTEQDGETIVLLAVG
jgi:hypothetical protein